MNTFTTSFQYYLDLLSNPIFVCIVQIASFITLTKIVMNLTKFRFAQKRVHYEKMLFIFFMIPIFAVMIDNIFLVTKIFLPRYSVFVRCFNCLAWIFLCVKFYSLFLFVEHLIHKKMNWNIYHKIFIVLEFLLCIGFIANTIALILNQEPYYVVIFSYYILTLFAFFSIVFNILKQLNNHKLPTVLHKQLKTLLLYFLCPHFICILIELLPIILYNKPRIVAFSNFATILIAASIYFCFKKIMQFRFLNLSDHVQVQPNMQAATDFKQAIEQISVASNHQELTYITQQFCLDQLGICKEQVQLHVQTNHADAISKKIELFLSSELPACTPIDVLNKHKILIRHEIEFDEFYTDNAIIVCMAQFLRSIQADIFVPIIHNKKLLGSIIVRHDERNVLYSMDIQNKLMVFAQFLAPAMYMMQQQNTFLLLQESKDLKESLYEKHQEIAQYKESIKQLLKDRLEHHIGIIMIKTKQFIFKNQEAQQLLGLNPNEHPEHPTSLSLINFVHQVEKFQTTQNMHLTMQDATKLIISGMPQAESNAGVLLIIRKPEATDLIKMHIDALQNSSYRDYLLYLETTKAGQTINKLLPSNHETFVNIKIQLLHATLQNSSLLLEMHQDDIDTATSIIHNLSAKNTLHTIDLHATPDLDIAKIFGINPLLDPHAEPGLLEKLAGGTLLIKNIEYASVLLQQKLAHLLRYGIFTSIKSEQRKFCDTRIICATSQNLLDLYQDRVIIEELHVELKKHYVQFPSLVRMHPDHIINLIDGFMYQHMQNADQKSLRPLHVKEKQSLAQRHIASLFTLQQKVLTLMSVKPDLHETQPVLKQKTHTKIMSDQATPEIAIAAQLGKHALKDIQLMKMLWKQFGNQTKIAELLGVNRSSVNRRCKEYNLV
jgi:transcriptional regulator with PAS, ATPase and Fis domain